MNRSFKAVLSLVLTIAMSIGFLVLPGSASIQQVEEPNVDPSGNPVISISSISTQHGTDEVVTATISLNENPGIASLKLFVSFDQNSLEAVSAAIDEVFAAGMQTNAAIDNDNGTVTLNWVNVLSESYFVGTFATIQFKAVYGSATGNCRLVLSYDQEDVYNNDYDDVVFDLSHGAVTISHNPIHHETDPATCTEVGTMEYWSCAGCDLMFSDANCSNEIDAPGTIPEIGHAWGRPEYVWSEDNSQATATRVCGNDETHVETETVNTTSEVTKAATCDEKGETTYTAAFQNPVFSTQTKTVANIDELGHTWGEVSYVWNKDNSQVTATRVCATDANHVETETVNTTSEVTKPATCEADGDTTYTAEFQNPAFETQTKTLTNIQALGHAWGEPTYTWTDDNSQVTATRICGNDANHVETETVNTTSEITKAATCDEKGETTYTAVFQNQAFSTQTKTVANIGELGHAWGEVSYVWTDDNSQVTATRVCATDANHVETETVNTTSEVTKAATCEADGDTTYTAVFENPAFETQTKTLTNIDALGHDWGDWTVTTKPTCTEEGEETRICQRDATHAETRPVDALGHDYVAVLTAPTCTERGYTTYTCSRCKDSYVDDYTDALGHDWDDGLWEWASDNSKAVLTLKCKRDESHVFTSEEIPSEATTEGIIKTYTVTLVKDGKTYSDTRTETISLLKDNDPMYLITVERSENGKVSANYSLASPNMTVKLIVQADEGFELANLSVITFDTETEVELDSTDNGYTFVMPSERVTVKASFKSVNSFRFDDVPEGSWYEESVNWAATNGITNGVTERLFAPLVDSTRAQIITFLWRAVGEPEVEDTDLPFDDVSPDAFCYKAVLWAYHTGVTVGTAESKFSPEQSVTRVQLVTLLYRYSGSPEVSAENPFEDVPEDNCYRQAVLWAVQNKITNGISETTFAPNKICNRAEAVTFFYAMFK